VDRAAAPRGVAVGHCAALRHRIVMRSTDPILGVPCTRWASKKCSLRRHLQRYLAYYHEWRTHLSLNKDTPVPRPAHASVWHDRSRPTPRRFASPLRTSRGLTVAHRTNIPDRTRPRLGRCASTPASVMHRDGVHRLRRSGVACRWP
jgi:hypothetical protein